MTARTTDAGLETEAKIFAQYLVGRQPAPEHIARYIAADRQWSNECHGSDDRECTFLLHHPWAAGPLDTASALLRPDSRFRAKMLRMAAILEASPQFADRFLPECRSRFGVLTRLMSIGVSTAWQLAIGIPLLLLVKRWQ
jgi:hypothetical protein